MEYILVIGIGEFHVQAMLAEERLFVQGDFNV